MAAEPAIRTEGLTKRYGDLTAVDHLDLEVMRGEVFGLLGPNGAGKTTTILMLLGLSEPTEGRAEVMGLDPTRRALEVKRRVGYLPDNVGFYDPLTGRENLRYTARLNGLRAGEAERRVSELLETVGLPDVADKKAGTYSRGMRQRLGIADALVKTPDVLILDEPTVAIDPEGVTEILDLIRALARERDVTLLLSSHLLHQVQSVCDRVGIFVRGRMVASGRMSELAEQLAEGPVSLEVGVEGEPGAVEQTLRAVQGVQEVERDSRTPGRWVVRADRDVREEVARSVIGAGLDLSHLRSEVDELDEIYRRYFEREEARGGVAG